MASREPRRRCTCGTRLARDNRGPLCTACTKDARTWFSEPPSVPAEFWRHLTIQEAVAAQHMGAVVRAFRMHPHHGRIIRQEVAATWFGITQGQLSRLENSRSQMADLTKLMHWAHVLGLPADLRWFEKSGVSPSGNGALGTTAPDEQAHEPGGVLLPVVVGDRQVLVPLDAETIQRHDLGSLLDELATSRDAGGWSGTTAGWNTMSPLSRRSLLTRGVAVAALPALGLDEVQHVTAALEDARRYLDGTVVDYVRRQLESCKDDDGTKGPAKTLPTVLTLLEVIQQHARDVKPDVHRQLLRVGAEGAEFAGWLFRDIKNSRLAVFWRDRATEWAQVAGDHAFTGYVLLKKAQAAYDERDASDMLALAQAAQTGPWHLPKRVRADIAQQEARGHAMIGDSNDLVQRKLDEAHRLLADATTDDDSALGAHYNQALLTMQTAICYTEAGQPRRAAELYDEWLSRNEFSKRDYGYFLSLRASALALAGEPDAAATIGMTSLPLAQTTNSKRTAEELGKVLVTLTPWENRAAVRELREAVLA